jgi:predicted phage terminase large subunit-like protein
MRTYSTTTEATYFPAQIKQVEAQAAAWKPYRIAIESNAYQRALPQWLRQGLLPVVEVKQSKDKVLRLTELAPYFENGTLRMNPKQEEFLLEYLQFPKGAHDDILDALHLALSTAKEAPAVVKDLFGD